MRTAVQIGDTCLHRGCIPSKAMPHAAELVDGIAEARERWGVKATLDSVDWPAPVATRDDIVTRDDRGVEAHLAHAGVRVVRGSARLTGRRTVQVEASGPERPSGASGLVARRGIVLATGSRPRMLPGLVPDGRRVVTSDDALFAPGLPASVLVLGGGAIGVEYASFHRSTGAEVTVVEAADRLVPLEDGVRARVRTARGDTRTVEGFVVPRDRARLETAVPGIHVVGDLLPPPSLGLAHASFAEGLLVAETPAGLPSAPVDYATVPRVTYSSPQTLPWG